ncbi:hypothetical protein [Thiomonas sp. FB-6]|uniref:hypothetical protein n=1 Tax=Thiomonas sp. FB-6 TaxID=1158291 RepID=UPI0012DE9E09|nr:hypothetical protein [Thiomonas sp. FB-6]
MNKKWIEDHEIVGHGVDARTLEKLIDDRLDKRWIDRRNHPGPTSGRVSYDREARYPMSAKICERPDGLIVLTEDDMLRDGDIIYLDRGGISSPFVVVSAKWGRRTSDVPRLRVLICRPKGP